MLKIHTSNGQTALIDLEDEDRAREWIARFGDPSFQSTITGLTIANRGVQYSLPRPVGFQQVSFHAELVETDLSRRIKGGERVTCFAGDVRATIMVHKEQRAAKMSLLHTGKQRFNPWGSR